MKLRFHCIHLSVALSSVCAVALSQDAGTTGRPVFIAADVHPSPPGLRYNVHMAKMVGPVVAGGLLQVRNATILDVIGMAYGFDRQKVVGGPRWLDWDRFDINAVAPADSSAVGQKAILRALLRDRFKLVSHAGSQPVNMWVLSASAKPKMARANADDGACQTERSASAAPRQSGDANDSMPAPVRTFSCLNVSISSFAAQIAGLAPTYLRGVPIVDQTGLTGGWTFSFTFTPNSAFAAAPGGIPLEAALSQQLGLSLALRPVPTDVLVIDAASETPTPNDPEIAKVIASKLPNDFEVASVKPTAPAAAAGLARTAMQVKPGGGIVYRNVAFSTLVDNAFVGEVGGPILTAGRIVGIPESLRGKTFDIDAKPPSERNALPATNAVAGPLENEAALRMVRSLLIDRFDIQYHVEIRQLDGFDLIVASPSKLKGADPNGRVGITTTLTGSATLGLGYKVVFQNVSMPEIAEQLTYAGSSDTQGMPIVEATGLDGRYDLTIDFNPGVGVNPASYLGAAAAAATPQPAEGVSLTSALRAQAGLDIKKVKVPVKVLVIDHVSATPKEN